MNYKPQPIVNKKHNLLIGLIVFLFTLLIYYLTFARSLSFWDAGEYIACSSILGVPHPPGNPFYILLGRFVAIFSFGLPHAQVINFLSSIFSAFAVMFTYFFTVKIISMFLNSAKEEYLAFAAGIIAAIFTAFSFTFWHNAIEAEVYSGLAFTINLIVWLTFIWLEKSDDLSHQNLLLLIIYIFFLGFGIHQTSLQVAPAVLFVVIYPFLRNNLKSSKFWSRFSIYFFILLFVYIIFNQIGKNIQIPDLSKYLVALGMMFILYFHLREKVSTKAWLLALLFIFIGLSTHFFLFARSETRPFINEGHPHNLQLFTDYILRRQYGTTSMFVRRASFLYQMKEQFLTYFSWQFFNAEILSQWLKIPQQFIQTLSNLLITLLGFGGAYYHYKKNKHSFAYFAAFFLMASLAMVFVMNLSDTEVRERDYFFVTAYNFWTVWMAIGAIGLFSFVYKKIKIAGLLVGLILLGLPFFNLASQYFIHDRSREYIALGYGQNILNSVEENAIIFTNGDNDTFPVWYAQAVYDPMAEEFLHPSKPDDVIPTEDTIEMINRALEYKNEQCNGIRLDVSVANLSLLNTPWYIKQLRDKEGVEFNIPDAHIEQCQTNPNSVLYPRQIPKDMSLTIKGVTPEDSFKINFSQGDILYIKDLAVLQIVKDNYGKRPIYFAVTVPEVVGFDNHLRNEGMVDRIVNTSGKNQYNLERLETNIDSVYTYEGVFDESIYKDRNMTRLLNNYGAAFMRASQFYHSQGDFDHAIQYIEKGMEFLENKSRFHNSLSQLYLEASFHYIRNDQTDKGFNSLEKAVYYNRYNKDLIQLIYRAALDSNQPRRGILLLNSLKAYQDTSEINVYIDLLSANNE